MRGPSQWNIPSSLSGSCSRGCCTRGMEFQEESSYPHIHRYLGCTTVARSRGDQGTCVLFYRLQAKPSAPPRKNVALHPLLAKGAAAFSIPLASHLLQNLPSLTPLSPTSSLPLLALPSAYKPVPFSDSLSKHLLLPSCRHETGQQGCLHSWPLGPPSFHSLFTPLLFLPPELHGKVFLQGQSQRSLRSISNKPFLISAIVRHTLIGHASWLGSRIVL